MTNVVVVYGGGGGGGNNKWEPPLSRSNNRFENRIKRTSFRQRELRNTRIHISSGNANIFARLYNDALSLAKVNNRV